MAATHIHARAAGRSTFEQFVGLGVLFLCDLLETLSPLLGREDPLRLAESHLLAFSKGQAPRRCCYVRTDLGLAFVRDRLPTVMRLC